MQGFIILAIIGTEKLIVTEVDGRTEIGTISHPAISRWDTHISHPAINRCDKKS